MKNLLLSLAIISTTFVQQARAVLSPPYFGDLRVEVTEQLTIASNAPTLDKKLITALRKALTLIDKANPTNLVSDTKTLTMLTTTLNKSSLSNVFDAELQGIVDIYWNLLLQGELQLSNRLAATFPSGPHMAAQNNLDQLLAALATAGGSLDSAVAAKALALAAKKAVVAAKLTTKAEDVPPPSASITANVTGAVNHSVKTLGAGIVAYPGNIFIVNGGTKPSIHGFLQLAFTLNSVLDGTSTVNITAGDFTEVMVGGKGFVGGMGTATVTYNSATKSMFGSFIFTAHDENNMTSMITVTGSFSGTTTP